MTRRQVGYGLALLLIALGLAIKYALPHWLWQPLGVCSGRACGYQLWSGVAGSCVTGSGIWTGALTLWWHHTCHVPGCLRPGRHPTADGLHWLCPVHHPDLPDGRRRSLEEIHAAHRAAKARAGDRHSSLPT